MNKNLTVIDFFCGAGGFSEGFRQQGFEVAYGVDNCKPATDTFNHNFNLKCKPQNIMDFSKDIDAVELLLDTDIILGSPPCVDFSTSNKCGKADKSLGVSLIEIFFRIVAVKKHKKNSKLKAWFMENVSNSKEYIKPNYSFSDLHLTQWAKNQGLNPSQIAIDFENNNQILNSSDYGVAQTRKRLFAGEIVNKYTLPEILTNIKLTSPKSLKQIFEKFPKPFSNMKTIIDPNYPSLELNKKELTDYAYDTGIYKADWENSQYQKINHPYMGKMTFPENFSKPSRTIVATKIVNARETIIYPSEIKRCGNGEYRTPTIREAAILMSFPINYQFVGSENTKWKLVGNAVCPLISGALAKQTLKLLGKKIKNKPAIGKKCNLLGVDNLNNSKKLIFDNPSVKKKNSRFRRQPFKAGNIAVALSNYDLTLNSPGDGKWRTTITYGTGKDFKMQKVNRTKIQKDLQTFIKKTFSDGSVFLNEVHNGFSDKIATAAKMQKLYENNILIDKSNPINLIEQSTDLIKKYDNGEVVKAEKIFKHKEKVHKKQIFSLYIINYICIVCNRV